MSRNWSESFNHGSDEADDVVDARTDDETIMADPSPTEGPAFGRPTPCPDCAGKGYLDHIDIIDRLQHQHCVNCGLKWVTTEAEFLAAASEAELGRVK